MTFFIIVPPGKDRIAEVSKIDIGLVSPGAKVEIVKVDDTPQLQLNTIASLNLESGDVICFAGLCIRRTTLDIVELAKSNRLNYMPGAGVDHRGVIIPAGKINKRKPIEQNYQTAWPYLMIIGDPESAKDNFKLFEHLTPADYWPNYVPDTPELIHLLGAIALAGGWQTPEWFKLVDLSIRDLELAPVMYGSHTWHDWIAFYPANGNFKLENHSQIFPVWLDESEKPLEHWHRG
jgi:hypothetical protein